MIVHFLLRGLLAFLARVPPALTERGAVLLGGLVYRLDGRHRRIALDNLHRAFGDSKPPAEIRRLARAVFVNLFRLPAEVARVHAMPPSRFSRYFTVEGSDHLRRALARGRGMLGLTAHLGNWELASVVTALVGAPGGNVYRPLDYRPLDRLIASIRSRFGNRLIPNNRGAMRKILRDLSEGRMVGLLMDQNVDWYEGVFVDFFGHRACTNKGLALLALKSGAPVLPVFVLRENGGFRVVFGPEIPLVRSGDKTRDVEANTRRYNQAIEDAIRRHPDQWFWVHQRWKTRPWCDWPRC